MVVRPPSAACAQRTIPAPSCHPRLEATASPLGAGTDQVDAGYRVARDQSAGKSDAFCCSQRREDIPADERKRTVDELSKPTAITYSLDLFPGTLRPLSRHAITLNPYCHRRCAVARAMPKCQQIAFHGVRSDRAQTNAIKPTWHLPFPLCQRLQDFAGFVDEKPRDRTEGTVLQGDNSHWHACVLQLDGQDLDPWTLGKSQY